MRHGETQPTLSTVKVRPAGTDWMVVVGSAWKVAVTLAAAVMVRFCGFVAPVSAPLSALN